MKKNVEDLHKMKGSFIKRHAIDTLSDNKWQRVTTSSRTSDNNWNRVTTYNVLRVTTSDTASDNERQRVTANGNEWPFRLIFLFSE